MLVNSQIYLYFLQALNSLSFKYYLSPSVRIYIKEILYPDCSEGFWSLLFNGVLAYIKILFEREIKFLYKNRSDAIRTETTQRLRTVV